MLTAQEAKQHLHYDQNTGEFIRAISGGGVTAGSVAGRTGRDGYRRISVKNVEYVAHRLAWLIHYGSWPALQLDHINAVKSDNRIENLRLATNAQQNMHKVGYSKDGLPKGVARNLKKFMAQITIDGKYKYLGTFDTAEQAHAAYCSVAREAHGEFFSV